VDKVGSASPSEESPVVDARVGKALENRCNRNDESKPEADLSTHRSALLSKASKRTLDLMVEFVLKKDLVQ
jgi:ssDNA-binding replication factor A large subunit